MSDVANSLDRAVRSYRAAQAAVEAAQRRVAEARTKAEAARVALHEAIVAAGRDGARQVDLVRSTGYTRERIRQILRAGGVEP